ncbi:MAG: hypothetical protein U0359_42470 [Byssovorax sp.]
MSAGPGSTAPDRAPRGARLLRRSRLGAILYALLSFAGAPALFIVGFETGWGILSAFATYLGGLLLLNRALTNPGAFKLDPRALHVEGDTLLAGDERLLRRSEVAQAFVSSRKEGGALVRLKTKRGRHKHLPLTLAVPGEDDGRALLHLLSLDASRSVASYQVGSRWLMSRRRRALVLGLFAAITVLCFGALSLDGAVAAFPPYLAGPGLILGTLLSMLGLSISLVWPSRILVGPDGVVILWLGTARRIAYGDLVSVEPTPGALRLGLASGEMLELSYPGKGPSEAEIEAQVQRGLITGAAELHRAGRRIEEAWRAHREAEAQPPELLLERGGREKQEWLRQIKAIARGTRPSEAGYRAQVVEPDKLWALVENASMRPTARVGAAVALSATMDDAGKQRLRIAAEASALPGVQKALLALSRDEAAEEEALSALLDEAAEDEARLR